mgnify:FL=1
MKPVLCLDFDGVIHSYTSGWRGADVIPDPPVPGAIAFLREAVKHFRVAIFSSRTHQYRGLDAMKTWLREAIEAHHLAAGTYYGPEFREQDRIDQAAVELLEEIQWPIDKPAAMVTLDDRAITFTGEWPSIESLLAFKPWNKP